MAVLIVFLFGDRSDNIYLLFAFRCTHDERKLVGIFALHERKISDLLQTHSDLLGRRFRLEMNSLTALKCMNTCLPRLYELNMFSVIVRIHLVDV